MWVLRAKQLWLITPSATKSPVPVVRSPRARSPGSSSTPTTTRPPGSSPGGAGATGGDPGRRNASSARVSAPTRASPIRRCGRSSPSHPSGRTWTQPRRVRKRWSALATIAVPSSRRTRQAAFVVVHAACTGVGTRDRMPLLRTSEPTTRSPTRTSASRTLVPSTMRIRVSSERQ